MVSGPGRFAPAGAADECLAGCGAVAGALPAGPRASKADGAGVGQRG